MTGTVRDLAPGRCPSDRPHFNAPPASVDRSTARTRDRSIVSKSQTNSNDPF